MAPKDPITINRGHLVALFVEALSGTDTYMTTSEAADLRAAALYKLYKEPTETPTSKRQRTRDTPPVARSAPPLTTAAMSQVSQRPRPPEQTLPSTPPSRDASRERRRDETKAAEVVPLTPPDCSKAEADAMTLALEDHFGTTELNFEQTALTCTPAELLLVNPNEC